MRLYSATLLAGLLLAAGAVSAAERGFPRIQTYTPDVREAEIQNFDVASDPRGLLYVANGAGVLVYDGAWWRLIPVGTAKSAFSVASDAAGRIGVGGVDELGYLAPDEKGSLQYVSLLHLLPPGQREFGQVMQVHPTPGGFAYLTTEWLAVWDGSRIVTVASFPGDRPYAMSFTVGEAIYVWTREGIVRLAGRRLVPVPGGEVFRGRRVDLILPADRGLLVSVRGEGLFRLADGQVSPFAPEASRWTAERRLFSGARLADGRWVLGSLLGGLLLLRPDGEVDQAIGGAAGLPDDFVSGVTEDREGSLWVALDSALARVEVASPLSVIDRRAGLQGNVLHVTRHRGDLWAATTAGLFTTAGEPARPVRLRAVPGVPPSAWYLLSMGEDLLVGDAFGVYRVRDGRPELIPGTDQRTAFVLARSRRDPERVWVGTSDGLAAIRREGTEWRYEGMFEGAPRDVRTLVEGDDGVVWCGSSLESAVGVEVAAGTRPRVYPLGGREPVQLFRIAGRILAARGNQVLRLDEAKRKLVEDPALALLGGRDRIYQLAGDAAGNLWMNTRPVSVARRQGNGWAPAPRSLVEVPARSIETIVAEPDGTVWLTTENGLLRYSGPDPGESAPLPAPLLARVTAAGGAFVFGGAPGARPGSPDLPPDLRRLRIEFAPASYRAGLRYQTRLDPLDADWSDPAAEPFVQFPRLPPGRYTFRVRTAGPNGEVGPETAWPFRVRQPWYATPWAFLLWIGIASIGARAYLQLRHSALQRRAAQLEARVAQQTVELRRKIEELGRAHDELEAVNSRLEELSLHDDLTGVANRRRLQQALEEEWARARRHQTAIGFVLLDLDHFKRLNDTRGHSEGDLCLQKVARYLAGAVRRTGDLVARYGGEEFAVLLPDTDLAGALQWAEQLRRGIEQLALPHEAAPEGRVTASLGVAALIPEPGQRLSDLIEAADLALYRAKTEGRNRVCAGDMRSVNRLAS